MENVIMKYVVIEVDGEATLSFPVPSLPDGQRHQMIEAVLASNPVVRLVDDVEIGKIWNGTHYA
jgi:hypothetical protein